MVLSELIIRYSKFEFMSYGTVSVDIWMIDSQVYCTLCTAGQNVEKSLILIWHKKGFVDGWGEGKGLETDFWKLLDIIRGKIIISPSYRKGITQQLKFKKCKYLSVT